MAPPSDNSVSGRLPRNGQMNLRHHAFSAVFKAIAATSADRWGRGLAQGRGVILTLHHVRPRGAGGFRPNGLLEITPHFLDRTLGLIRAGPPPADRAAVRRPGAHPLPRTEETR